MKKNEINDKAVKALIKKIKEEKEKDRKAQITGVKHKGKNPNVFEMI